MINIYRKLKDITMAIKSAVFVKEEINNAEKKFGAASSYYPFWVVDENGEYSFALLTLRELETALERGSKNPEDQLPRLSNFGRLWDSLLAFLRLR
jgi:hypothetical protein